MARPKKNNADYFTHDSDMRNDVRIKAIRRKYKLTGYAIWNFILEVLTDSDYFEIEWTELSRELLSADFDVEVSELTEVVDYCVVLGLLQLKDNKLYSETHQERFKTLINKRQRDVNRVIASENPTETPQEKVITSENPHSKEEKSKVKESKVNNINPPLSPTGKNEFDFSFVDQSFKQPFTDWLAYKASRKEKYKSQVSVQKCYNQLLTFANNNPPTAQTIVDRSIANNWAGLFALSINETKNTQQPKNPNQVLPSGERYCEIPR